MLPRDLNPSWNVRFKVSHDSYWAVKCLDHPAVWPNGYVYEHRLVLELKLGRFLTASEVAHHEDENGLNNDPENLVLKSVQKHASDHAVERAPNQPSFICAACGVEFQSRPSQRKGAKTYCSKTCRDAEAKPPVPPLTAGHGSASMYRYHKCKCDICRAGNTERARVLRKSKRP